MALALVITAITLLPVLSIGAGQAMALDTIGFGKVQSFLVTVVVSGAWGFFGLILTHP